MKSREVWLCKRCGFTMPRHDSPYPGPECARCRVPMLPEERAIACGALASLWHGFLMTFD